MPSALITGVTGQDGAYLATALLSRGWQVHGLVRHPDPELDALLSYAPDVQVHEGDLADPDSVAGLVAELEPDHIYNLGGISSVAFSWEQPILTAAVTGLAAGSLLDAAWRLQQRTGRQVRFLQASSAEIFGAPDRTPQDELTPVRPLTPYGAAKAFAHHLVGVYRALGLHAGACILYNHESPRRPDTFVTRKITKAAAAISLGSDDVLELGNLDVRRDWGWAPDYVDAMQRAINHDDPGDYVIATGQARSVGDFVAAAFRCVGIDDWRPHVTVAPALVRTGDAREQVGDARKARDVLGWEPTVDFDTIVRRMVETDLGLLRVDVSSEGV